MFLSANWLFPSVGRVVDAVRVTSRCLRCLRREESDAEDDMVISKAYGSREEADSDGEVAEVEKVSRLFVLIQG